MGDWTETRNWDTAEAARYLGCTAGTLRVWTSRRFVPFIRVGRLVKFRKKDLDRWMEKRKVSATN